MREPKSRLAEFERRIAALRNDRRKETIEVLRNLIRDMHCAGYGVAQMGRLMRKDHTTVLHHLRKMGLEANIYTNFLTPEERARLRGRIFKEEAVREKQIQKKRKRLRRALMMYISGRSVTAISTTTGVARGTIYYLAHKEGVLRK